MIPISSVVSRAASGDSTPNFLTWTKGKRGRSYELTLGGEVVGRMERPGFWSSSYAVETADGRWTFRQTGCVGGAEIVDEASGQIIATMKSNWGTGGGTLTFNSGPRFELTVSGWWHPVWTVKPENAPPVLRLHVRQRTVELPSGADAVKMRLSLLAMFAYYRVLKAEEDAAVAVMTAAVS